MRLISRTKDREVKAVEGKTILEHALIENLEWGFSCLKGTCARCRCLVEEGVDSLQPPTDAEINRLMEDEIEEGYRLGCQAKVVKDTGLVTRWKPYF